MKEGIPYAISEYVNRHFRDDFLFTCHQITRKGKVLYDVEVTKDDITHQLWFDEDGELLKESWEPNFEPDSHDEARQEIEPE